MKLPLKEFAACLNSTPGIVERWIRQGRIPVQKKGDLCIFSRSALQRWADTNNLTFTLPGPGNTEAPAHQKVSLLTAMKRGGVLYDIAGNNVAGVLKTAVGRMGCLETDDQKEKLYLSLMEREKLMSTGIGNGVAIPHPRTPLGFSNLPAIITTCFLKAPVDYSAVDNQPVSVLFILVAPSAKLHLHLLSRLSYCLRDEGFLDFLKAVPDKNDFYARVAELDSRLDPP